MDSFLYYIRDNLVGIHYLLYSFILLFFMFAIIGHLFKQKYAKYEIKLDTSQHHKENIEIDTKKEVKIDKKEQKKLAKEKEIKESKENSKKEEVKKEEPVVKQKIENKQSESTPKEVATGATVVPKEKNMTPIQEITKNSNESSNTLNNAQVFQLNHVTAQVGVPVPKTLPATPNVKPATPLPVKPTEIPATQVQKVNTANSNGTIPELK